MTDVSSRTNERPGTRAQARSVRMSATKARVVLDLIRDQDVRSADEILRFSERDAALVIRKLLRSAVANAEKNDEQIADDLYVATCYADEGRTIRRFRPRARGRATRIRKRSCNITIIVARMTEEQIERQRAKDATRPGSRAARRAGQIAAEEGGRSRRSRRRRGGQGRAAEVARTEEEQGIVDPQAAAVAAVEQSEEAEGAEEAEEETLEEHAAQDAEGAMSTPAENFPDPATGPESPPPDPDSPQASERDGD